MSKSSPNTWDGVKQAAEDAGAKYPELVAAQWALESGWGKHTSGENNFFGLKGQGTDCVTEEVINGERITVSADFINFSSLDQCVAYLVTRWYMDWQGFTGVNNAPDADAAAKELVKQGYATDPDYASKLIKLMKDQAGKAAKSKSTKPVLFRITAVQDTFLKKSIEQAADLGEKEKVAVETGRGYAVCAYTEVAAEAHAQIELASKAGTWFVFEPHWKRDEPLGEALPASVDWSDFACPVTANLTVGEILQWDKRRIPAADSSIRQHLLDTAQAFQQVRDAWGAPLGITSFYRPEPINQQVGGVPGSRHVSGEAFDCYPVGRSLESFYQWIRVRWTGGLGDGRNRGFIHLDRRANGHFVPGAGVRPWTEWLY